MYSEYRFRIIQEAKVSVMRDNRMGLVLRAWKKEVLKLREESINE